MAEAVLSITMMRAALEYAERGWHVFPVHSIRDGRCSCGRVCGRPGKHPRTTNGSKAATLDHGEIQKWWTEWPDANIGVACGPSGLLVVDVDPRNNGDETFADLEQRYGPFPRTLTACTGGGGQHYFYDVRGVDGRFKGRVLGQGIELQATGQYVIVSPSSHISGRSYLWDYGQEPEPAFPPPWLTEEQFRQSKLQGQPGAPLDCILGVAFSAAAMLGPALGPDRVCVTCPWEADHSQGSRWDTSTIVFGPVHGSKWGWFQCSHAHCKERLAAFTGIQRMHEVLRALPDKAAQFAQSKVRGADRELRKVVRSKWEESLVWDNKGENITDSAGNLRLMMSNMTEWSGVVAYDESKDRLFWTRQPPPIVGLKTPEAEAAITEHDWVHAAHWFSLARRVNFKKETAADALVACGQANARNSLGTYLENVRRDDVSRLDTWLVKYCGAADTPINRRIGRAWLISAVARAMQPGCQVDHVLVLEGKQGSGKTSVFRALGGEWYLGNLPRLDDKDARHILSGAWLVEIQELAALRGAAIEKVKAFITETFDQFRPPYGRQFVKRLRRCVFGASTNEGEYVHDSTGARRFWPVKVGYEGPIDTEGLLRDRGAIWAEARDAYLEGEQWWIPSSEQIIQEALADLQLSRQYADPWEDSLVKYLEFRDMVTSDELLNLVGIELSKRTPNDAKRIGAVLQALGWERRKLQPDDRSPRRWYYVKKL